MFVGWGKHIKVSAGRCAPGLNRGYLGLLLVDASYVGKIADHDRLPAWSVARADHRAR